MRGPTYLRPTRIQGDRLGGSDVDETLAAPDGHQTIAGLPDAGVEGRHRASGPGFGQARLSDSNGKPETDEPRRGMVTGIAELDA